MGEESAGVRDDVVLPASRALSAFIIPFLVVAFVVLYGFPGDTDDLFAWPVRPPMTPMTLGAVYLGGAYFFLRAFRAKEWHTVASGFLSVATFATLMGVATIIHWDKFTHDHVAFWLWAGLYFTTPFLVFGVWMANRRRASLPAPGDLLISPIARRAIGALGLLAVAAGAFLFLAPSRAIDTWPWMLTPLTSRVLGAIFMLGLAGIGVLVDPRWSTTRLMLQVQCFMMTLILVAAVRARHEFDGGRPMGWLLLGGFVGALVAAAALSVTMDRRAAGQRA